MAGKKLLRELWTGKQKNNILIKSLLENGEKLRPFLHFLNFGHNLGCYKVDVVISGTEGSIEIYFLFKSCQEYKVADCFENLKNIKGVSQVIWGSQGSS